MSEPSKYVVITTINAPTPAISGFGKWAGWQVVVVGDRKTPKDWEAPGVVYLGLDDQYAEFGELARTIPENTYTRKMLGYAYAIRRGATAIFESDDDNLPYPEAMAVVNAELDSVERFGGKRLRSEIGWLNIYNKFGARDCWPRGFPLEHVRNPEVAGRTGHDVKPWSTIQFLADEDPDVDAVYRMLNGYEVSFARGKKFLLDEGTYCPINSQATLWLPEAFPLLFLPLGVPDRVTDILRGYIALSVLWKMGRTVAYASPVVFQQRNAHNLLNDFKQEIGLYLNANRWTGMLRDIDGITAQDAFTCALSKLVKDKALPAENIEIYKRFLGESQLSLD